MSEVILFKYLARNPLCLRLYLHTPLDLHRLTEEIKDEWIKDNFPRLEIFRLPVEPKEPELLLVYDTMHKFEVVIEKMNNATVIRNVIGADYFGISAQRCLFLLLNLPEISSAIEEYGYSWHIMRRLKTAVAGSLKVLYEREKEVRKLFSDIVDLYFPPSTREIPEIPATEEAEREGIWSFRKIINDSDLLLVLKAPQYKDGIGINTASDITWATSHGKLVVLEEYNYPPDVRALADMVLKLKDLRSKLLHYVLPYEEWERALVRYDVRELKSLLETSLKEGH